LPGHQQPRARWRQRLAVRRSEPEPESLAPGRSGCSSGRAVVERARPPGTGKGFLTKFWASANCLHLCFGPGRPRTDRPLCIQVFFTGPSGLSRSGSRFHCQCHDEQAEIMMDCIMISACSSWHLPGLAVLGAVCFSESTARGLGDP
jgi:hypothetical protein